MPSSCRNCLSRLLSNPKNVAEQSRIMLEQSKQINDIQKELIKIQQEIKTKETGQNSSVYWGFNQIQPNVGAVCSSNPNTFGVNPSNQRWTGQPSRRFPPGACYMM